MRGGDVPKKFQGQMHILGGSPADEIISQCLTQAGGLLFDCVLNMLGKFDGDKGAQETHAICLCLLQDLFHSLLEIKESDRLGEIDGSARIQPDLDIAGHTFC